jgi:hypothetical protein
MILRVTAILAAATLAMLGLAYLTAGCGWISSHPAVAPDVGQLVICVLDDKFVKNMSDADTAKDCATDLATVITVAAAHKATMAIELKDAGGQ